MERSGCPTKLTDLFCVAILFAKFNMLAIFILHFLTNIAPNDFPMEQWHGVSPHKVWREAAHGRWKTNCFKQIYWKG